MEGGRKLEGTTRKLINGKGPDATPRNKPFGLCRMCLGRGSVPSTQKVGWPCRWEHREWGARRFQRRSREGRLERCAREPVRTSDKARTPATMSLFARATSLACESRKHDNGAFQPHHQVTKPHRAAHGCHHGGVSYREHLLHTRKTGVMQRLNDRRRYYVKEPVAHSYLESGVVDDITCLV